MNIIRIMEWLSVLFLVTAITAIICVVILIWNFNVLTFKVLLTTLVLLSISWKIIKIYS